MRQEMKDQLATQLSEHMASQIDFRVNPTLRPPGQAGVGDCQAVLGALESPWGGFIITGAENLSCKQLSADSAVVQQVYCSHLEDVSGRKIDGSENQMRVAHTLSCMDGKITGWVQEFDTTKLDRARALQTTVNAKAMEPTLPPQTHQLVANSSWAEEAYGSHARADIEPRVQARSEVNSEEEWRQPSTEAYSLQQPVANSSWAEEAYSLHAHQHAAVRQNGSASEQPRYTSQHRLPVAAQESRQAVEYVPQLAVQVRAPASDRSSRRSTSVDDFIEPIRVQPQPSGRRLEKERRQSSTDSYNSQLRLPSRGDMEQHQSQQQVLAPAPAHVPVLTAARADSADDSLSHALAVLSERGAVLKMIGAGASAGMVSDVAYVFQIAKHDGLRALVLRWSHVQTGQPVGFQTLSAVSQLSFDVARMAIRLLPPMQKLRPIHLEASRREDFDMIKLCLEYLYNEHRRQANTPPVSVAVAEPEHIEEPRQVTQRAQATVESVPHLSVTVPSSDKSSRRSLGSHDRAMDNRVATLEAELDDRAIDHRVATLEAELVRVRQSMHESQARSTLEHTQAWVETTVESPGVAKQIQQFSAPRDTIELSLSDESHEMIVSLHPSQAAVKEAATAWDLEMDATAASQPIEHSPPHVDNVPLAPPIVKAEAAAVVPSMNTVDGQSRVQVAAKDIAEPSRVEAPAQAKDATAEIDTGTQTAAQQLMETLAQRLRALSYGSTGQDPTKLLRHFDRDNTGELDLTEFTATVRKGGKMSKATMSDADLRHLFDSLDRCSALLCSTLG